MKTPNKISRIRLLMIISHILLTLFVFQWIVSRYYLEKAELKKDLQREFLASEEKMLDSLLLVNVVDPFLNGRDKSHLKMYLMSENGRISIGEHKNRNNSSISQTATIKISNDTLIAGVFPTIIKTQKINLISDSLKSPAFREKFLVQSFKILTNKISDSIGGRSSIAFGISSCIDSSLIQNEFISRPIASNFKLSWLKRDSTKLSSSDLYFESNFFGNRIGVEVESYDLYILRKISPQIVFGLILILLTGASFIVSFVSLKKQIQLNLLRNEFVGNISHELKTPVSTVKVVLEALQNFNIKNQPIQADEYIRIAQNEMDRLDRLIQKVLTSSTYEDSKNLFLFETLDLYTILNEVICAMQVRFDQIGAEVTIEKGEDQFPILADRIHIEGVIVNLLDNSMKYVDGKPLIAIKIFSAAEKIILTISDNGIGIPEEYINKVFEKFFRVPTENRHNVKGYGLGLNYAATVMKQHQGSISVANRKEGGCTFTLTFPKL
jgi:signal transduction histidine kinase